MGNTFQSQQNLDQKINDTDFEDLEEQQRIKQQELLRRERLAQLEREQFDQTNYSPPKQRKPDFNSLSQEEQVSHIFEQILQVSIIEEPGNPFFSLKDIEKELIDPKHKKPLLNKQNVQDFVIYEVLQSKLNVFFQNHEERVKYLLAIIKKCATNRNNLQQKDNIQGNSNENSSKKQANSPITADDYQEIIETCFNYLITLLTQFESFDLDDIQDEKQSDIFDTRNDLLTAFYNNFNRYSVFAFDEVLDRLRDHDEFQNIMNSIFKRIYNSLREKGSIENIEPFLNAIDRLKQLFTKEYILDYFLNQSPFFYSDQLKYGVYIEGNTIFGLMLSLTTFPSEWKEWADIFKNITFKSPKDPKAAEEALNIRKQINDFHQKLFHLLNSVARKRKDRLIFWIEKILEMNKGILKTYHQHEHCSNPGFLYNFLRILLHFSTSLTKDMSKIEETIKMLDLNIITEPTGFFKFFDHIQILDKEKYEAELLQNQLEQSKQEQKIQQNMTNNEDEEVKIQDQNAQKQVISPYKQQNDGQNSDPQNIQFISQIYRFIMAATHLNLPLFKSLKTFQEKLHQLKQAANHQMHIHFHNHNDIHNFNIKIREEMAYNILIEDPYMNTMLFKFFELQILYSWKLNNQQYDETGNIKQLQTQYTQKYAQLPFFFMEDINEFTSLVLMLFPKMIQENKSQFQKIIDSQIIMMGYRQWCNNPHFRQKIIEIFSMIIGFDKNHSKECSPSILLHSSSICKQYMIPGLLQVFIEIEKSSDGHHHQHQLNEKFIFRYHFCKIFTYLLENQQQNEKQYSKQLIKVKEDNKIMFLEFANLYFNDLIFLLDIISNQMCKYFHFQTLNRNAVNQIVYYQKESEAKQAKQLVKKYSQYLAAYYKNIETISLYTDDIFLQDEIKLKLTNFINISFLKILTYHHLDQLNDAEQKKLGFDLKMVVICIVKLYLQYSNYEKFLHTLVEDERVFDIEAFKRSVAKLETLKILSEVISKQFSQLSEKIIEVYQEKQRTEALLYTEVPDKYLDPILSEIMKDPVKLPKSDVVIDRVTIVKHLLNDKTDPFTRDALQESDLIPMPELKLEIEEFVKNQLLQKKLKDQVKSEETEEQKKDTNGEVLSSSNTLNEMISNQISQEGNNQEYNLSEIRSDQELQSNNNIDEVQQNQQ